MGDKQQTSWLNVIWGQFANWLPVGLTRSLASLLVIAISLPGSLAKDYTFSIERCCTIAAREDWTMNGSLGLSQFLPWDVCHLNGPVKWDDPTDLYPSVTRNMSWIWDKCNGWEFSGNAEYWLSPLATYFSPYVGVLLLCPIGDAKPRRKRERRTKLFGIWRDRWNSLVLHIEPVIQHIYILGDPASAISGAFCEIWWDLRALSSLRHHDQDKSTDAITLDRLRPRALCIAALLGDQDADVRWTKLFLNSIQNFPSDDHSNIQVEERIKNFEELDEAINLIYLAQRGFMKNVLLPMVIMLAVTAASFYDTYQRLGDKRTAASLAFCILLSWIIVLGVAGKCLACAISPTMSHDALARFATFLERPQIANIEQQERSVDDEWSVAGRVPLRDRFVNRQYWECWIASPCDFTNNDRAIHVVHGATIVAQMTKANRPYPPFDARFWARFAVWQLLGCLCVMLASGCASEIGLTTPTTGVGCRTLNYILYGSGSLVTAFFNYLRCWAIYSGYSPEEHQLGRPQVSRQMFIEAVSSIYFFLVCVNGLVFLITGLALHLSGIYQHRWCEHLTSDPGFVVELNTKTPQGVENAQKFWLVSAHLAFGGAWAVCVISFAIRALCTAYLDTWLDRVRKSDPSQLNESEPVRRLRFLRGLF